MLRFGALLFGLSGCFEWKPPPTAPVAVDAGVVKLSPRMDRMIKRLEKGQERIDALLDGGV